MYNYHLYSNLIFIEDKTGKIYRHKIKPSLANHAVSYNYWIIDYVNVYNEILTSKKYPDIMSIYPAYYFIWSNVTQEFAIYKSVN